LTSGDSRRGQIGDDQTPRPCHLTSPRPRLRDGSFNCCPDRATWKRRTGSVGPAGATCSEQAAVFRLNLSAPTLFVVKVLGCRGGRRSVTRSGNWY